MQYKTVAQMPKRIRKVKDTMSEEYTLVRDIVYDHNERMLNIKKYYPFFKLSEISFLQYKEGRFEDLDMGYITMAVLRFFIEENNFKDKLVSYNDYLEFMHQLLKRDFLLVLNQEEEKELAGYIFDKLKNDGKPFTYDYFDPATRKKHTVRVKLIDNKIIDDKVLYYITSDAIEFYLDTKEIKDESNITIAQILLEKMIATRNFRGGTEVVQRINNEVSRLIARKNEILNILSFDVFEGIKAYNDYVDTGVKWFEEEQKLFKKNKQLIEQALKTGESDNRYFEAMDDIYHLENELNRSMRKHGELLNACALLQKKVDEIIRQAKISRLRSSLDFRKVLANMMDDDSADNLSLFTKPVLKIGIKKMFSLSLIDNLLSYRQDEKELAERANTNEYAENFKYEDEIEEERINNNYHLLMNIFFDTILSTDEFDLVEFNRIISEKCGKNVLNNVDYYSFLVHLCQKQNYDLEMVLEKPDTFLEGMMENILKDNKKYQGLKFEIQYQTQQDVIKIMENEIVNIRFVRR